MRSLWNYLFSNPSQLARQIDVMRKSEASLMEYAFRFGQQRQQGATDEEKRAYDFQIFDTKIPKSSITSLMFPSTQECKLLGSTASSHGNNSMIMPGEDADYFIIHGVKIQKKQSNGNHTKDGKHNEAPLVLLHGYANGALYFYRNLIGLANHFPNVYSLDLLGWGLSSRPSFDLVDKSVETAEAFFVESLEQWRIQQGIDTMILAGHSMGGYISIAYCEKYPQHVQKLVLISPVGVPHVDEEEEKHTMSKRMKDASILWRMVIYLVRHLFENDITPGAFLRALPEARARSMVSGYVTRRLPAIACKEEQESLIEYLYTNSILPGSGEYALNRILKPLAYARKPTVHRIPNVKVPHITFIYGEHDWMDVNGGLDVQRICHENATDHHHHNRVNAVKRPDVDVLVVKHAGHLLMLENWEEFNNSILLATCSKDYLSECISSMSPQPLQLHYSQRMASYEKVDITKTQQSPNERTASSNPPTAATTTTNIPTLES